MTPPRRWERVLVLLAMSGVCMLHALRMVFTKISDEPAPFGYSEGVFRYSLACLYGLAALIGIGAAIRIARRPSAAPN